jgi:hypothetical protein
VGPIALNKGFIGTRFGAGCNVALTADGEIVEPTEKIDLNPKPGERWTAQATAFLGAANCAVQASGTDGGIKKKLFFQMISHYPFGNSPTRMKRFQ